MPDSLFDPTGDFDVFDLIEEDVTYVQVDRVGNEKAYRGVRALRRALSGTVLQLAAEVVPDRTTWHVDARTLPVFPRRGDKVVSPQAGTYVVLSDDVQSANSRYRLECQRVARP
jgi:hypothetical protein